MARRLSFGTYGKGGLSFEEHVRNALTHLEKWSREVFDHLDVNSVKFPADHEESDNANTLDDYEEGTWTPAITFDTPGNLNVVSTKAGYYTKIGNRVLFNFSLVTSTFTHTTASGFFRLTGFPFSVKSIGYASIGNVNMRGWTKANYTYTHIEAPNAASTSMYIGVNGSGQANSELAVADVPTGGTLTLLGSGSYPVA